MPSVEDRHNTTLAPIVEIARVLGIDESELDSYGKFKAKVTLDVLHRLENKPNGKYIVVTAITPTPLGEGKTTTAIGLAMAMNRLGYRTSLSLRQPAIGPVLSLNRGAAGGGNARIVPSADVNLHLTGDSHAVATAHNLLASFLDNSLYHGNPLGIDPFSISWPRVVDVSDRALRQVTLGLGGKGNGVPRESGFEIVSASEVMAILALTTGASQAAALKDLRTRLGRIVVGMTRKGKPVTAEDLACAGAMTVLLREALKPNLIQTVENTPAFVHTGPFGHIAHGNNSIVSDQVALKLSDYVLTESGFGSDLGMEKFFNIKCRVSGLTPNAVVLVGTLRSLKLHGGARNLTAGGALPAEVANEDPAALEKGLANLVKHVENIRTFGVPAVVAVNRFPGDTDRELAMVEQVARQAGAEGAYVSEAYARGASGAISLAEGVARAANKPSSFRLLYPDTLPVKAKIDRIVTSIYGGEGADFSATAESKLKLYTDQGYDRLPVCMAKTHLSLSHDDKLKGRPRGFRVPIQDVQVAVGAGYINFLCGEIRTMPGLAAEPAATRVDIDDSGEIKGLD